MASLNAESVGTRNVNPVVFGFGTRSCAAELAFRNRAVAVVTFCPAGSRSVIEEEQLLSEVGVGDNWKSVSPSCTLTCSMGTSHEHAHLLRRSLLLQSLHLPIGPVMKRPRQGKRAGFVQCHWPAARLLCCRRLAVASAAPSCLRLQDCGLLLLLPGRLKVRHVQRLNGPFQTPADVVAKRPKPRPRWRLRCRGKAARSLRTAEIE